MILLRHFGELLETHAVVLVGVLHASLGKHAGHHVGAETPLDADDGAEAALALEDLLVGAGSAIGTEHAHLAHLLDADRQAHLGLAGLDRHHHRADRRRPRCAGVGHVVHGNAGLAELLLETLADAAVGLVQASGGEHVHLGHGHPAIVECTERGLSS